MSRADIVDGLKDLGLPDHKIRAIVPLVDQALRQTAALESTSDSLERIADALEGIGRLFGDDAEPVSDRDGFVGHKAGCDHDWQQCVPITMRHIDECRKCGALRARALPWWSLVAGGGL